ncbi:hypothetical protein OS493_000262 [Desmophyllum pertusum]|uniref:Uncharacterized protein n=1 Tax=Desmophyllum pertusum TaxID=174260 RepID=A0A9X0DCC0_9CNID|nr:hypothetical protein OS493_000262 [Desmophyllum pertusum]
MATEMFRETSKKKSNSSTKWMTNQRIVAPSESEQLAAEEETLLAEFRQQKKRKGRRRVWAEEAVNDMVDFIINDELLKRSSYLKTRKIHTTQRCTKRMAPMQTDMLLTQRKYV